MDLPPYWIGLRCAIADKEGQVPPHEQEDALDMHFCSAKCASEYFKSEDFKIRMSMVDKRAEEGMPDEE